MTKILKRYLKPYTLGILLCTVFLFIQANMDLALPDYMSRIVNVGIQQNGVESPVPKVLRESTMSRLLSLMDEAAAARITEYFDLVTPGSADYPEYRERYPNLDGGNLYVLNEAGEAARDVLEEELSPVLAAYGFLQSSPAGSAVPPGQVTDMIARRAEQLGPMMTEQGAIRVIQAEYEALGLDTGAVQNRYILSTGSIMLLFTLISITATIFSGLLAARIAAGAARKVRGDLFRRVERFTGEEFDTFSTASLITRTTNDVTQIQLVTFMLIRMVLFAPIMGIGGVIRALDKAPSMAWIIALAVIVLLGLILTVLAVAMPKFKRIQKLIDRLNLVARENLSGLMVVRAFNRQQLEEERFDQANKELTRVNLFVIRVGVVMMPAMMLIMNLLSVGIIWIGAHQVAESTMQVGDMMAFLQYAMQIVMSFLMLSFIFIFLPRAAVSGRRIMEVIDTEPAVKDPEQPKTLPPDGEGRVEFRNVCFRYPGAEEDALHDINFTAMPGKTTAIIGATGSGKSTVVKLIPRLYDICGGAILLDGTDIREVTQHDLRSQIGYVPQKTTLFSGTIAENLRYADEGASREAVEEAAETAQAMEFIREKEEEFETPIAQGGANVSGGQKQRLSIARALVKQYPVLIFDDSFSALDFRTDAALRRALKNKTGGSAIIIIAQRVATIMKADQILVLEDGRIVGKGNHAELMKNCPEYREIVESQIDMKELA
ncbi:MAG: ABC transporter ATP-binding protein [Spirochaetia bacterium]